MVAFENPVLTGLKITTVTEQIQIRTISTEYFKAGFERIDTSVIHPHRDLYTSVLAGGWLAPIREEGHG